MGGTNNAIACQVSGIQFPSKLEALTYLAIRQNYPYEVSIAAVNPHKVLIKVGTERFPQIDWKVDFYLPVHDVYIESKGKFEIEWKLKMKMLDLINPQALDRMLIVSYPPIRCPWKGARTVTVKQLAEWLRGLK